MLALLVIAEWAIVYFKYKSGGFFHLTLVVAVITLIVQWFPIRFVIQSNKKRKIKNSIKDLSKWSK